MPTENPKTRPKQSGPTETRSDPLPFDEKSHVGLASSKSDRRIELATKLVDLAKLQDDWDTYGAQAPSMAALGHAFAAMLGTWSVMAPEDVLPSVEGGVTLVYSTNGEAYAEIEFDNDGEIVAAFKRPGERPKVWDVRDDRGVEAAVKEFHRLLGRGA